VSAARRLTGYYALWLTLAAWAFFVFEVWPPVLWKQMVHGAAILANPTASQLAYYRVVEAGMVLCLILAVAGAFSKQHLLYRILVALLALAAAIAYGSTLLLESFVTRCC